MQIYVNDQKFDASLSEEKNLNEVYHSINEWTTSHNKYILGFLVDGNEFSIHDLKTIQPDTAERFDVFIGDEVEMMISTIDELDRYLDQIGTFLFTGNECTDKEILNLRDGMHWIKQIMLSVSTILKIDMNVSTVPVGGEDYVLNDVLDRLHVKADSLSFPLEEEQVEDFLENLRGLKFFIMKLGLQIRMMNADIDELMDVFEEFETSLETVAEEISSVNESFNTGNDDLALNSLDEVTEKLNRYLSVIYAIDYRYTTDKGISLFKSCPEGKSLLESIGSIINMLKNISTALEKQDMVSAGDILEYELSEELINLRPHISGIKEFLVARK